MTWCSCRCLYIPENALSSIKTYQRLEGNTQRIYQSTYFYLKVNERLVWQNKVHVDELEMVFASIITKSCLPQDIID